MAKETAKTIKKRATEVTPIAILWKGVLMLPISGTIDSKSVQEIMEMSLAKILETESKVIILDILGVPVVDSAVANHLIKITKAGILMGCQAIITGISPAISQTMVNLGIELKDVITCPTLASGLEKAFDIIGVEVRAVKTGQAKIKV